MHAVALLAALLRWPALGVGSGLAPALEGQRQEVPKVTEAAAGPGRAVLRTAAASELQLRWLGGGALAEAGIEADFWSDLLAIGAPVDIMLGGRHVAAARALLEAHGLPVRMLLADVEEAATTAAQQPARARGLRRAAARGGDLALAQYHDDEEIAAWVDHTASQHSAFAAAFHVGSTHENRTVKGLRVRGRGAGPRPVIFVMCGIHAREWISPAACIYLVNKLLTGHASQNNFTWLVDNFEWHIVPLVNADGYAYTWTRNRLWRKTRRPQRAGCVGADANRNWGPRRCVEEMSRHCASPIYCGDAAFSEPSVRNVATYLQGLKAGGADLRAFLDVHACAQAWIWPQGGAMEAEARARCGRIAAEASSRAHGTAFRAGPVGETLYGASGSGVQWAAEALGVRHAYAVELRNTGRGFLQPASQIQPQAEELLAGLSALAGCMHVTT